MSQNGWIGVDLDGTIAEYRGWQGELHIGAPIPAMVERVKGWLAQGIEVRIFTARVFSDENDRSQSRDVEAVRKRIEDWTEEHIGTRLRVTNVKDYGMMTLWDDRAVRVVPNTGAVWSDADEMGMALSAR